MADVCRVVDPLRRLVDRVEILREAVPGPLDPRLHRRGRNVFGPLQIAHHQQLVLLRTRRQGKTAVPHHHRRDAMPARARTEAVPEDLRVHMRMAVNKAGGDDMPVGFDHFIGGPADLADLGDAPLRNPDVGAIPRQAGAVNDRAIADNQIVLH